MTGCDVSVGLSLFRSGVGLSVGFIKLSVASHLRYHSGEFVHIL